MESIEPVWIFGAIALVAGVFLGMLINRFFNPGSAGIDKLKAELEQERTEMERYKASVNSHFDKTSELVNELTQDYVKVYRHLAEGAQTLSDTREFSQVLEQPRGRVLISVDGEGGEVDSASEQTDTETASEVAANDVVDEPAAVPVPDDDEKPATAGFNNGQQDKTAAQADEAVADGEQHSTARDGDAVEGEGDRTPADGAEAEVPATAAKTDGTRA